MKLLLPCEYQIAKRVTKIFFFRIIIVFHARITMVLFMFDECKVKSSIFAFEYVDWGLKVVLRTGGELSSYTRT